MTFTTTDLNSFAVNIIKDNGMNAHQLDSYNHFIKVGIKQIIEDLFQITRTIELNNKFNDNVNKVVFTLSFSNIRIMKPSNLAKNIMLVPSYARINDTSYNIEVKFDILCKFEIHLNNDSVEIMKKSVVDKSFELPCMVKSESCNLYGMNENELKACGEDPCDIGGYFIINGKEWVINLMETKLYNYLHIYDARGHENERTRADSISKPGDGYAHSSEIIIKILVDGSIVLVFHSHGELKTIPIPFYLIYKLFGIFIDKTIIEYITSFTTDESLKIKIIYSLVTAFSVNNNIFNKTKNIIELDVLIKTVAECMGNPLHMDPIDVKMTKLIKVFEQNILTYLDTLLLPHLGKTSKDRTNKLYHLSWLIYNVILVDLGINKPTDRDNFTNKRIYTSGQLMAKELKSIFNLAVARPIDNRISEELRKNSIHQMLSLSVILNSVLKLNKLTSTFLKAIVTGQKDLKISNTVTTQNKIPSEQLIRKNNLNSVAPQRTVRSPTVGASKSSARAHEMRRVHLTQIGYICPMQSADTGENVGIVKQLAIGTSISLNHPSNEFKKFVLSDEDVIEIGIIDELKIGAYGMTKILINGVIIGVTQVPNELVMRFREYRRGFDYDFKTKKFTQLNAHKIDPFVTIIWDFFSNNIYFWLDHGRMLKPFLIVRNNSITVEHKSIIELYFGNTAPYDGSSKSNFKQQLVLKKEDVNLSIKKLLQNGIIEYIAPGELDNMLIAIDINTFYQNVNNGLLQFTHVDIPCLNYGLPALSCPYASHNQAPRITFQTNQTKQTIGIPTLNVSSRIDKHMFYSFSIQMPLVTTIYNDLIYPNGVNTMVAVMCFKDNQEDSLIINGTATERTLFESVEYNYIKVILEQNEYCGLVETRALKANFEKLGVNHCIPKNIKIEPNDALLAKYLKMPDGKLKNTSYIYRGNEPIVVEDIVVGKTQDGYDFYKFKFYIVRICAIGDKFSSRHGQKGSISSILPYYMLPFTSRCEHPDMILNTFALPGRMTIGQLLEGVHAKIAALTGKFIDGTMFQPFNMKEARETLNKFGYEEWGNEVMYDGLYGHPINNKILLTPIMMQKLQKFGILEQQATSSGPHSIITKQPLDGKANDGGLRYGEMEKDVAISSGGMHFPMEKLRDNSDGYYIYVCINCHKMITVNEEKKIYKCNFCTGTPNIVKFYSAWMTKTTIHHLEASNIGVKIYPEEYEI